MIIKYLKLKYLVKIFRFSEQVLLLLKTSIKRVLRMIFFTFNKVGI